MEKTINEIINEITRGLMGEEIWYVSCCGAAGSTFGLDMGRKIPRAFELKNKAHPKEFRQYEGEVRLNVWCNWRLDNAVGQITNSDDTDEVIEPGLEQVKGRKIIDVQIDLPFWDLHVKFDGDLTLHVFSDCLSGDSSLDNNWEVWLKERAFFFGPGQKYEILRKVKQEK